MFRAKRSTAVDRVPLQEGLTWGAGCWRLPIIRVEEIRRLIAARTLLALTILFGSTAQSGGLFDRWGRNRRLDALRAGMRANREIGAHRPRG